MVVPIYIYPKDRPQLLLEIPDNNDRLLLGILDGTEEMLMDDKPQLSVGEFGALLDELTDKFVEFAGPDVQPLSDYAVSRKGIYEDHL